MNKLIIFVLGATAGSLLTWKILDKKYKQIADEEIEAIREHYKKKDETYKKLDEYDHIHAWKDTPCVDIGKVSEDPEYQQMVDDLGYTEEEMEELIEDPSTVIEHSEEGYKIFIEPEDERVEPFVIAPDEFGERVGYDAKSWTYYSDYVLTDDEGEIVSDPEEFIGDGLDHFGEFEDDCVHIRNENIKCDYEILKHEKTFSQVYGVDN